MGTSLVDTSGPELLAGGRSGSVAAPVPENLPDAVNTKTGEPIGVADHARRVVAVNTFLAEITEWGWNDAPKRKLLFRNDVPRLPKPLRYIPVDADRSLTDALCCSDHELAASALLPARACGLRIGELLDREIDCVHEIPRRGSLAEGPARQTRHRTMISLDEEPSNSSTGSSKFAAPENH